MKGTPDNFDEYGYIRRIEERYARSIDTTIIRECIYEPDLHGEIECLFTDWVIDSYNGKPDREKTMELIKFTKEKLWKESLEGIEIEFWVSPQERMKNLEIDDVGGTEEEIKEAEEYVKNEIAKRKTPISVSEYLDERLEYYINENKKHEQQSLSLSDIKHYDYEISEEEMEAFDKIYMETFPDCYDFLDEEDT